MSYRYLIMGATRTGTARALYEYRNFIRNNPESDLTPCLASVMQKIRLALREQRKIERAIGWGRKPLESNK